MWVLAAGVGFAGFTALGVQSRLHQRALSVRASTLRLNPIQAGTLPEGLMSPSFLQASLSFDPTAAGPGGGPTEGPAGTPGAPGSPDGSAASAPLGQAYPRAREVGPQPAPLGMPSPSAQPGGPGMAAAPMLPVPEVVLAAAESGADAVARRFATVVQPVRTMDQALLAAAYLVGLSRYPGGIEGPARCRNAYATAAVADAVARSTGGGYLADPAMRLRRRAIVEVREVLAEDGASPRSLERLDEMLLAEARTYGEFTALNTGESTDPLLQELAYSAAQDVAEQARLALAQAWEQRARGLLRRETDVCEQLRQVLVEEHAADPRGTLEATTWPMAPMMGPIGPAPSGGPVRPEPRTMGPLTPTAEAAGQR